MASTIPKTAREIQLSKIGSYKNLTIKENTVEPPKANEVLVKVHAVSLQYRDLAITLGKYNVGAASNLVPCSDMAGKIVALGEDVKDLKIGDRVCANFATEYLYGDVDSKIHISSLGGQSPSVLTEYRSFPAYSIVKFPDFLSYEQASTLPCAALTAYNALHGPVPIKAGDYVLVLGTGGVSIFALQFAVASGAVVIATSSSDEKLKIAKKLGAKHVINYSNVPDSVGQRSTEDCTNQVGVDHVIEVGGDGTLPKSMSAVRMGGYIHLIGFIAKEGRKDDNFILTALSKAIILRGIYIGSVTQFKDMNRLITANPEKTVPVFPFDKAIDAYAHLESQKHVGKVVIKVA